MPFPLSSLERVLLTNRVRLARSYVIAIGVTIINHTYTTAAGAGVAEQKCPSSLLLFPSRRHCASSGHVMYLVVLLARNGARAGVI